MKSIKYTLITNSGISAFGYSLYIISFGVALLDRSGDPKYFVYVLLGFFLSSLVSTGLSLYLSRHVEAIRLNLVVDALRVLTSVTLIAFLNLELDPRLFILTSIFLSILTQLFRINTISIVGTLFSGGELTSYLGKVSAAVQIGGFAGGILIGLIVSYLEYEFAFYINALCFFISFLVYTYVSFSKEVNVALNQRCSRVASSSVVIWQSIQSNALKLIGLVLGTLGIAIANISLAPVIENMFDNDFMWLSAIEVMMCLAAFSSVLLANRKPVFLGLPMLVIPLAFGMIASEYIFLIVSGFFVCSLASIYLQTTCLSSVTNALPNGYKGFGYMLGQLMTSIPLVLTLVLFELNNQSFQRNLITVSITIFVMLSVVLVLKGSNSSSNKNHVPKNS